MENVELETLRKIIDAADGDLLTALAERTRASRAIGAYKHAHNMPALDTDRWHALLAARIAEGKQKGLSAEFITRLYTLIHEESVTEQKRIQAF